MLEYLFHFYIPYYIEVNIVSFGVSRGKYGDLYGVGLYQVGLFQLRTKCRLKLIAYVITDFIASMQTRW
jgi:hypothetical protein